MWGMSYLISKTSRYFIYLNLDISHRLLHISHSKHVKTNQNITKLYYLSTTDHARLRYRLLYVSNTSGRTKYNKKL